MEKQVPTKAAQAVKVAYKQALNAGHDVLVVANGTLYKISVSGLRTPIKKIGETIPVPKGIKFRIR
jgi:hypothetical protein